MSATSYARQLNEITNKLINKKEYLAQNRFIAHPSNYSEDVETSLRIWRENLIDIYARSISQNSADVFERLKEWGQQVVDLLVNLDLPLDLAIEEVRFYRQTIGEFIKDEAVSYSFSLDAFYEVISKFDSVVDRAVHWLSISYSRRYNARITAAKAAALELSVPVIRVTEKIGILPLVGDLDTERAQELMDKALYQASELRLEYVIIDLSGVPLIDTMVAHQIFKVIDALSLSGITVKLSGIRPDIAQTIVGLGLSIKNVSTFASLHQAIKKITALHL